jgi:hypothetical protein
MLYILPKTHLEPDAIARGPEKIIFRPRTGRVHFLFKEQYQEFAPPGVPKENLVFVPEHDALVLMSNHALLLPAEVIAAIRVKCPDKAAAAATAYRDAMKKQEKPLGFYVLRNGKNYHDAKPYLFVDAQGTVYQGVKLDFLRQGQPFYEPNPGQDLTIKSVGGFIEAWTHIRSGRFFSAVESLHKSGEEFSRGMSIAIQTARTPHNMPRCIPVEGVIRLSQVSEDEISLQMDMMDFSGKQRNNVWRVYHEHFGRALRPAQPGDPRRKTSGTPVPTQG